MPKLRKFNAFYFAVEGTGSFPTDMLRYDRCAPEGQEDLAAMHLDSAWRKEDMITPRRVDLISYVPLGYKMEPTIGRWESFGWRVVPGSVRPSYE